MKKLFALLLVLLAIPAFALGDVCEYAVSLPEGYDAGDARYPVIFVLPEDGCTMDNSGLSSLLEGAVSAIIVRPAFETGADPAAELSALAAEVDSQYRTIADGEHRALVGTGVGGYLAYAIGLAEESKPYAILASVRGNFAGEDNPYIAAYGSMYEKMKKMNLAAPGVFDGYYTYMDAPVDDAFSGQAGSTADLGALFIGIGTGSAAHEFTLRPGSFDEAFLAESASRIAARLNARWYPAPVEEEAEPVVIAGPKDPVIDGDYQAIDLSGEWHFYYAGAESNLSAAALTTEETETWPLVPAAMGNWTNGFGNISNDNVEAPYGPDYFDYFIVGAGYYAKSFTIPAAFDAKDLILSIGYVDDRCEVFVNGTRVGATGMDENGQSTGETSWAIYSRFTVDPAILNIGGENLVIVRAWNDVPMGAGGWYGGPVGLYSAAAFEDVNPEKANDRFYEETFTSSRAAAALGQSEPVENKYLIYLPEGYATSGRRYPTVYLLHQFNSDHTSYKTDKINELMDAGIASGAFDEMIVVIPNSDGNSWWAGEWEKMVTEELIPLIDSKYRTIRDARYRLTAGCSMGGQGAMGVALRNPDYFSGVVSFYGAFSYGGASSPNAIAAAMPAEYMDAFSLYFICGNQDSYGFGVPAIELHKQLNAMDVNHRFFIDNGGHDSNFYVPFFVDAFAYIRGDMYRYDGSADALISGSISMNSDTVTLNFAADEAIQAYMNSIPASDYPLDPSPALSIPLTLEILEGDTVLMTHQFEDHTITPQDLTEVIELPLASCTTSCQTPTFRLKANLFDREITLATLY